MKKLIMFFAVFLLSAAFASAEVSFFGVADKTYNLGDLINADFNVSSNVSADALVSLRVVCSNYDLLYYLSPVQLAGGGVVLSAPELKVSSRMVGTCFLRANVESLDKSFAELQESSCFYVTSNLAVSASLSKQQALPADKLVVSVKVAPSYGVFSGTAKLVLDGKETLLSVDKDEFSHLLELDKRIKSGEHKILISLNDSFGNRGSSELVFWVQPVPSELRLDVNREVFDPGEVLRYYAQLLDQAGDDLPSEINAWLVGPAGEPVFEENFFSNSVDNFTFARFFAPGVYVLKVSAAGFESSQKITVSKVENINVSFDNRTVTITNIGNVPYEKTIEIMLTSGAKDYVIVKDIYLKPNESVRIDLFKAVKSSGKYDVKISAGEVPVVYKNVTIEDKRSFIEKIADTSGVITGNVFGVGERESWLGKKPVIVFLAIIALVLLYFLFSKGSKKRKEALMKKKIDVLEAERFKKVLLEKKKLEEIKKHKYLLDRSLRERDDIKRFIRLQQEKMKNK